MKAKIIAIILVLAILIIATGSVYSGLGPPGRTFGPTPKAHPWEDFNNNNGPSGCKAMVLKDDRKVLMIPIFSDFLIWIYIKDAPIGSDHGGIKIGEKSYQIIFPW